MGRTGTDRTATAWRAILAVAAVVIVVGIAADVDPRWLMPVTFVVAGLSLFWIWPARRRAAEQDAGGRRGR